MDVAGSRRSRPPGGPLSQRAVRSGRGHNSASPALSARKTPAPCARPSSGSRSPTTATRRGWRTARAPAKSSEENDSKENEMGKLEGKLALITGGNSGIGLATAKRFVSEGAYVFITGRRDSELAAAGQEIERNVTAVPGDVSRPADLDRLFAQIKREKGRLDVLFANAGVAKYAPLGTITEEFYDSIFDINVKG